METNNQNIPVPCRSFVSFLQPSYFKTELVQFPNLPAHWRYFPHPHEQPNGNSSSPLQNAYCGQTSCYASDENVNLGLLFPGVVWNSALCSME